MCGIVGIVQSHEAPVDPAVVDHMAEAIAHRGPDDQDRYVAPGVGLAYRRLKIIDLETGDQPIANEDRTVWTVYNGEIYNFPELRADLEKRGHVFRTRSDTECLVHGYEEHGDGIAEKLRGMFAFAIWDVRQRRLLLARDRLGKKPLVYAPLPAGMAFASELQALLRVPGIPREIDAGALGDYLAYGYVPAPATIYRAVRKLPPGSRLIWEDGRCRIERYWRPEFLPKSRLSQDAALEQLEHLLEEAVRIRLISDVPLGALLSGGVDSSTVVALMARSAGKVKTFSVGFDEASFNELPHARRIAERYGTDHHEFVVRPEAAEILPTLVRHYGEPYADSSAIPTYYVSRLARQHVTVALNGDGGDEAFGGYDRVRAMWWAERLRGIAAGPKLISLGAAVARRLPPSRVRSIARAERFLRVAGMPSARRYARWTATIPAELMAELLEPAWHRAIVEARSFTVEREFEAAMAGGLSLVDSVLATDYASYLPNDLLVKMDIASMANSLETRSPLLDHHVVEFAARLPDGMKLHRGLDQKHLLKRLARKLLPPENIDRPKMGFGVPVGTWLRQDLRTLAGDALLSSEALARGYFRPERVRALWDEHQTGRSDHTFPLWTLLMLELWHREFIDNATGVTSLAAADVSPPRL